MVTTIFISMMVMTSHTVLMTMTHDDNPMMVMLKTMMIKIIVVMIYNNICGGRTTCVCMYFSTDLISFFPRKVWTQGVTWVILEVSNTTPSCRKPDKPSKTGLFGLPRQIYCLISTKIGTIVYKTCQLLKKIMMT